MGTQKTQQVILHKISKILIDDLKSAIARALKNKGEVEIAIDCAGGEVDLGLEIMNLIEASPVRIIGRVTGRAASMAAIILQCCHERQIDERAYLRFHYASWPVSFRMYFEPEMLQKNIDSGKKLQERLIVPIMKSSGMSSVEAHELLRKDKRLPSREALKQFLVDSVLSH